MYFFTAHKAKPTWPMYELLLNRSSNNTNSLVVSRKTTCAAILVLVYTLYSLIFSLFSSRVVHKTEYGGPHTLTRHRVCIGFVCVVFVHMFACMRVYVYESHECLRTFWHFTNEAFWLVGPKMLQEYSEIPINFYFNIIFVEKCVSLKLNHSNWL